MKYPRATPGTQIQYIGPEILDRWVGAVYHGTNHVPYSKDKAYTIAEVIDMEQWIHVSGIAIRVVGQDAFACASMWRPLKDKDAELFNEMLTSLPTLDEAPDTAERILETGWWNG